MGCNCEPDPRGPVFTRHAAGCPEAPLSGVKLRKLIGLDDDEVRALASAQGRTIGELPWQMTDEGEHLLIKFPDDSQPAGALAIEARHDQPGRLLITWLNPFELTILEIAAANPQPPDGSPLFTASSTPDYRPGMRSTCCDARVTSGGCCDACGALQERAFVEDIERLRRVWGEPTLSVVEELHAEPFSEASTRWRRYSSPRQRERALAFWLDFVGFGMRRDVGESFEDFELRVAASLTPVLIEFIAEADRSLTQALDQSLYGSSFETADGRRIDPRDVHEVRVGVDVAGEDPQVRFFTERPGGRVEFVEMTGRVDVPHVDIPPLSFRHGGQYSMTMWVRSFPWWRVDKWPRRAWAWMCGRDIDAAERRRKVREEPYGTVTEVDPDGTVWIALGDGCSEGIRP